jgi:hypothetical protein
LVGVVDRPFVTELPSLSVHRLLVMLSLKVTLLDDATTAPAAG